jgi:hypothetical protein
LPGLSLDIRKLIGVARRRESQDGHRRYESSSHVVFPKRKARHRLSANQDYGASDEDSLRRLLLEGVRKVCDRLATAIRKPTKTTRANADVKALENLVAAK